MIRIVPMPGLLFTNKSLLDTLYNSENHLTQIFTIFHVKCTEKYFFLLSCTQEQKRIRARLAATSAGSNHLACLTRVVIGEATSSSWRECLDVDNTFSIVIHNAKFYNFLNNKKNPLPALQVRTCLIRIVWIFTIN